MNTYELKIIPEKEKQTAQLNIILKNGNLHESNGLFKKIISFFPEGGLISRKIFPNQTLLLEVTYSIMEETAQKVELVLNLDGRLEKGLRQIFIKKLGGWFDF